MLNVKATRKRTNRRPKAASKSVTVEVKTQPVINVNKRKRRARGRAVRPGRGNPRPGVQLSDCAFEYAKAIADPWSPAAMGACVPVPGGLTQRATGWIRGSSVIGSAGTASILLSPSIANDALCFFCTGATYAEANNRLNPINNQVLNSTWIADSCSNLPFNVTQLIQSGRSYQPQQTGRIVSVGLRVWYTGKETNMAGLMYAFRDPNHSSVQAHPTATNLCNDVTALGGRRETIMVPNDRKGIRIADFPSVVEEGDMGTFQRKRWSSSDGIAAATLTVYPYSGGESLFVNSSTTATTILLTGSGGTVQCGVPTVAVCLIGTPGESYSFEYIIHAEYSGRLSAGLGVRAPADPVGFARVLDAAADAQSGAPSDRSAYWDKMMVAMREIQAQATPHVVNLLKSAGRAYLANYQTRSGRLLQNLSAPLGEAKDEETDELTPRRRSSMVVVE